MKLSEAIETVVTDQTNGWAEEEDPTPREAIAHVRNTLAVETLVPYGKNDPYEAAYRMVLEATDKAIQDTFGAIELEQDNDRPATQVTVDSAPWRDGVDVEVRFTTKHDERLSNSTVVALTLDELQELVIVAGEVLMARRGRVVTTRDSQDTHVRGSQDTHADKPFAYPEWNTGSDGAEVDGSHNQYLP